MTSGSALVSWSQGGRLMLSTALWRGRWPGPLGAARPDPQPFHSSETPSAWAPAAPHPPASLLPSIPLSPGASPRRVLGRSQHGMEGGLVIPRTPCVWAAPEGEGEDSVHEQGYAILKHPFFFPKTDTKQRAAAVHFRISILVNTLAEVPAPPLPGTGQDLCVPPFPYL